jgi:hypothetical protein
VQFGQQFLSRGDHFGARSYHKVLGLGSSEISYIAVAVVAAWCGLGVWLGRKQRALADAQAKRDQTASVGDIAAPEAA